jgi:hypothetical protein
VRGQVEEADRPASMIERLRCFKTRLSSRVRIQEWGDVDDGKGHSEPEGGICRSGASEVLRYEPPTMVFFTRLRQLGFYTILCSICSELLHSIRVKCILRKLDNVLQCNDRLHVDIEFLSHAFDGT